MGLIICTKAFVKGEKITTASAIWPNGIPGIGQKAQRSRTVTTRDIGLFTEISGDRNPLHYDEEVAKNTRFSGIVVQSGITSAILNAAVAEDLPGPGTVFLQINWSFKAPVRPNQKALETVSEFTTKGTKVGRTRGKIRARSVRARSIRG